jgi:hypothetical protein
MDMDGMDNLQWVRYRIQALKKAELKLREMRLLAMYVRDNDLANDEVLEIQSRLDFLKIEIDFLLHENDDVVN